MKVNELMMAIHRKDFNMEKELKVKKYLPMEEKKLIANGILCECTEEINGVIKSDSVQQYLSYVKYMLTHHTNLEYTQDDYDKLCSTEYHDTTLLNAIMSCFEADAKECTRILNLVTADRMQENSMEFVVSKFLSNVIDVLQSKLDEFDISKMIPQEVDKEKLAKFFNNYVK